MTEVIGVRFKKAGKSYYFDPGALTPKKGAAVIVETSRGIEYGEVAMERSEVEDERIVQPLRRTLRLATAADQQVVEQNEKFEHDAFKVCEERIARHGLEMKLVDVEYTFDRGKIIFYFSAEGRVDFRDLVKDLAQVFRTRIELRQIGVRDEAKMIGGLGICGRPLCCCSFMDDFQPVSINMAKEQGLSLNPTKISGTCGRLMCCLKFESETYQQLLKTTPPPMSLVDTPSGRGTVMDSNLLKGTCRVRLLATPDGPPACINCDECRVLRYGKDRGEPLPPEGEAAARPARPARPDQPAEGAAAGSRPPRGEERPRRPERPRPERPAPAPAPAEAPVPAAPAEVPAAAAPVSPVAPAGSVPEGDAQKKRRRRSHRGGRGRNRAARPGTEPNAEPSAPAGSDDGAPERPEEE